MNNIEFSLAMAVYYGDKVEWVSECFESIYQQTLLPTEIILVVDGIISQDIQDLIIEYKEKLNINPVYLEDNKGLANALRIAVNSANYDIIARMDSDDICIKERFEKQINYLNIHPDIDVVGGQISEFEEDKNIIVSRRIVPTSHEEIKKFIKKRCPFNHMTVMFRKNAVLSAGNYQDFHMMEDYYLWARMLNNGAKFANLDEDLCVVRAGKKMFARRGGIRYYKQNKTIMKYMYKTKIINWFEYTNNKLIRFTVQVLMPNKLREKFYKMVVRK